MTDSSNANDPSARKQKLLTHPNAANTLNKSGTNDVDPLLQELYKTADDNKSAEQKSSVSETDKIKTAKSSQTDSTSIRTVSTQVSSRYPNSFVSGKPTILTFQPISDHDGIASCVLVLCNISDVPMQFTLKSCPGGNVSASFKDGHIEGHSQLRSLLKWTRPNEFKRWRNVPPPRLVLVTRFLGRKNDDNDTLTRLLGRVSRTKSCTFANPPVEQLLLDAMGNSLQQKSAENLKSSSAESVNVAIPIVDLNKILHPAVIMLLIVLAVILVLLSSGGNQR